MDFLPKQITELIEAFQVLPGVGEKTAERYAFYLIRNNPLLARKLSDALGELGRGFRLCARCQNYTEEEFCPICANAQREQEMICVVSEPLDVVLFEEAGGYKGTYHVLHGRIAPLSGVRPDDLKIAELVERVRQGGVNEVILALDTDLNGEATAVYIANQLKPFGVRVSRLAQGLPQGGEIGYTDPETLLRALAGRREF